MRIERQRAIVRMLYDLADAGTTQLADAALTNPVSDYLSPEVFAAERDVLFRERPVLACLSADVVNAGDYYATESGGIPIIVVRGDDGAVRAFANVCRHRGSPLVASGPGHVARSFRCGFHGWVYDLEGAVIARPHANGGFDDLGDACSSLVTLPVAEAHGLVFVRPAGGAEIDLDAQLGGMGEELEEFAFEKYHRFDEWVSEWNANWKLLVDTFLETYHVPALHSDTVARHFVVAPSAYVPFGPNLRFHSMMKTFLAQREQPEEDWLLLPHGTVEYFLLPNAVLNFSVDHVAVYRFLPSAPDRTQVVLTMYTPDPRAAADDDEHYARTLRLHQRVSGGQDFTQQELIQGAITSGALPEVTFGRNEPAAIYFHQKLRELLRRA